MALLHGCRLGRDNRGHAGITGPGGGSNDAAEQGGHHGQLHTLLSLDATGKVALRQVREFVGHHRGVLGFSLGVQKQAAVDPDDAARSGKGVQLRAVDQHELQAPVLHLAGFRQLVHAVFDEAFQLWVVQLADLATQHA